MAISLEAQISRLIQAEMNRQNQELSLIASENYVSKAVLDATGSMLTNKYAEGYPGKRYYAGCAIIDQIESLAITYCKKLFNAEHVNVQPHSGSQANMAVYFGLLKPGDTILGMSLNAGGHLTHGHQVNVSGSWLKSVQYGVHPEREVIDYEEVYRLAVIHKPKLIIAGTSAYSRIIDFQKMRTIANEVDALLMADIAHVAGLVASSLYPSPFPHAHVVTSTTHKTLRGPRGGFIMTNAAHASQIDRAIIPGTQGGPLMHVIAAKAQAFYEALQPSFRVYQNQVLKNAQAMVKTFVNLGYKIVSGGTETHLFIIDLRPQHITGFEAEQALATAGLIASRSCIPQEGQKPWIGSGIRLGTPAITTRGAREEHAIQIAYLIDEALQQHTNQTALAHIRMKVLQLSKQLPLEQRNSTELLATNAQTNQKGQQGR
jgi:glycine hydroxymethyltransferase